MKTNQKIIMKAYTQSDYLVGIKQILMIPIMYTLWKRINRDELFTY